MLSKKIQLAQCISGHSKAPEQALQCLFKGMFRSIQECLAISPEIQQRVWESTSKSRLKNLKEVFLLTFCEYVLNSFKENDIDEMLLEYQTSHRITDPIYATQIETSLLVVRNKIKQIVIEKAKSMATGWVPEILEALGKEGIHLPKLKQEENKPDEQQKLQET